MENQGQIQDFLNVLKMRRWQIILPALFMLTIGIAIATVVPKKYLVVTRIELRETQLGESAATEREVFGAEYHIKHYRRVKQVIEGQIDQWPDYFELTAGDRNDYIGDVIDNIEVIALAKTKDRGSTFVDIAYSDTDPDRAESFLTELTSLWVNEVVERDLNAVSAELEILRTELQEATREWGAKKTQFHELAGELGIDPTQPVDPKFQNRGDSVSRRLEARTEERDEIQTQLAGMIGALAEWQDQLARTPPTVESVFEEGNPFDEALLSLESEVLSLENEQRRFKKANSKYSYYQSQIDAKRREIKDTETLRDKTQVQASTEPNPEYARIETEISQLQAQVSRERSKLAETNEEIANLSRQQISRRREFETLTKLSQESELHWEGVVANRTARDAKSTQLRVMQDAYGRPFDIAQEPEASETPTEPNPILIVAVFLLLGMIIGLGTAVLTEFASNGFRSVHDLRNVMNVPVLGAINAIVTRAEARRLRARRTVVGLSSAIVLGSVLWLTWTWYAQPDRLPLGVFETIEGFRKMLS